jgi:rubrerythrin
VNPRLVTGILILLQRPKRMDMFRYCISSRKQPIRKRSTPKECLKCLKEGNAEVAASFPAGVIGSTVDNLLAAAAGEEYEQKIMYPGFAKTAKEEGFADIASVFLSIAVAERQHEKRYRDLAANITAGRVFKAGG